MGAGLVIRFDDQEFQKALAQKAVVIVDGARRAVWKAGHKYRNRVMDIIRTEPRGRFRGAVGSSGELRKRIHVEQGSRAGVPAVQVKPGVFYAVFVHEGTRPHFPPLAPLEVWVRRKLKVKGEKKITRVARSIQYAIGQRGTDAFPFFRIAEDRHGNEVVQVIRREIKKVI